MGLDWSYLDERTAHFAGRSWVFAQIRQFLSGDPGRLLVIGDPGSGKTSLAARIAQAAFRPPSSDRTAKDEPVPKGGVHAAYFCRSRQVDLRDVAQDLADQLASNVRSFADDQRAHVAGTISVGDVDVQTGEVQSGGTVTGVHIDLGARLGEAAIIEGVVTPLHRLRMSGSTEPIAILIDALDEATHLESTSILPELLAQLDGIHLIITSRNERRVLAHFEPAAHVINLMDDEPDKADDLGDYLTARLMLVADTSARAVLQTRIADAAMGNFLYARHVVDALGHDDSTSGMSVDDARAHPLPQGGLNGVYRQFLSAELTRDEEAWWERLAPIIGAIAAAQGSGLDTDSLQIVATSVTGRPVSRMAVRQATRAAGEFLQGPIPDGPFRLYHHSFAEFLQDPVSNPDYPIDKIESNQQIYDAFRRLGRDKWTPYAWDHLVTHAFLIGRGEGGRLGGFDELFELERSGILTEKLKRLDSATGIGADYDLLLSACEYASDLDTMTRLARARVALTERSRLVMSAGVAQLCLRAAGTDPSQRTAYALGLVEMLTTDEDRWSALLTVFAECSGDQLDDPRVVEIPRKLWKMLLGAAPTELSLSQILRLYEVLSQRPGEYLDWARAEATAHVEPSELHVEVWSALSRGYTLTGQDSQAVDCLSRALEGFGDDIAAYDYSMYVNLPGVERFFDASLALHKAEHRARIVDESRPVFDAFRSPVAAERISVLHAALLASAGREDDAASILRHSLEAFHDFRPAFNDDEMEWEKALYLTPAIDALVWFHNLELIDELQSAFRSARSTLTSDGRQRLGAHLVKLTAAQVSAGLRTPGQALEEVFSLDTVELHWYGCETELIELISGCTRADRAALEHATRMRTGLGTFADRARVDAVLCNVLVGFGFTSLAETIADEAVRALVDVQPERYPGAALSTAAGLLALGREDKAYTTLDDAFDSVSAIRDAFDRSSAIEAMMSALTEITPPTTRGACIHRALELCRDLSSRVTGFESVALAATGLMEQSDLAEVWDHLTAAAEAPAPGPVIIKALVSASTAQNEIEAQRPLGLAQHLIAVVPDERSVSQVAGELAAKCVECNAITVFGSLVETIRCFQEPWWRFFTFGRVAEQARGDEFIRVVEPAADELLALADSAAELGLIARGLRSVLATGTREQLLRRLLHKVDASAQSTGVGLDAAWAVEALAQLALALKAAGRVEDARVRLERATRDLLPLVAREGLAGAAWTNNFDGLAEALVTIPDDDDGIALMQAALQGFGDRFDFACRLIEQLADACRADSNLATIEYCLSILSRMIDADVGRSFERSRAACAVAGAAAQSSHPDLGDWLFDAALTMATEEPDPQYQAWLLELLLTKCPVDKPARARVERKAIDALTSTSERRVIASIAAGWHKSMKSAGERQWTSMFHRLDEDGDLMTALDKQYERSDDLLVAELAALRACSHRSHDMLLYAMTAPAAASRTRGLRLEQVQSEGIGAVLDELEAVARSTGPDAHAGIHGP